MYKEVAPSLAGLISLEDDEPRVSFGTSMGKIVAAGNTIDVNLDALDQAMEDSDIPKEDRGRINMIFAAPDDDKLLSRSLSGSARSSGDGRMTVVCRYRGMKQKDEELLDRTLYHELLHVKKCLDGRRSRPSSDFFYRMGVVCADEGEKYMIAAGITGICSVVMSELALHRGGIDDSHIRLLEVLSAVGREAVGAFSLVGAIALAISIGGYWLNQEEREARQAEKKYPGTPLVVMDRRGGHIHIDKKL